MEAFNPSERSHRPYPLRPNVFQPETPARVSTEPQGTKKSHLHGLHHPHRHHHRSRHAKDKVQSAIQLHPPSSFGDLLKQTSRTSQPTPAQSTTHSRRESVIVEDAPEALLQEPVRPKDLMKEREKAKAREEQLRSSLQKLSEHSLKTSRRLDDTYYSILEKVSQLRQTIANFQDLSGLTSELHRNFQNDTKELADEVQGQIEGFNGFETQEQQIKVLESRISAGREKADALNVRLEEARKRVEARAEIEADWEARNSRRMRLLWGIVGTVCGLLLIVILFQQLKPIQSSIGVKEGPGTFVPKSSLSIDDAPIPPHVKEVLKSHSATKSSFTTRHTLAKPSSDDDGSLRMFDEL